MPILHRFGDINIYLPKIKTSRDINHAHLGTICHHHKTITSRVNPAQNLTILSSAIPEKFNGV